MRRQVVGKVQKHIAKKTLKKTKFLFGDSEKGFTFAAAKNTADMTREILEWLKKPVSSILTFQQEVH